jgi:toxin ParE1/3/4
VATVKIRWTKQAIEDLEHARDFIASQNPSAARSVITRIESALHALRSYPEMGRRGRVEGTRELIVSGTPFVIPYRFGTNSIEVLAVMHGHRRWPESF